MLKCVSPGFWQQPHLPLMGLHFGCYAEAHSPFKPNRRRDVPPAIVVRDGGMGPTPPPESAPCGGPDPFSSSHRIGGIPPSLSKMVSYATNWLSLQKVSQGLCSSIQPFTKGWPHFGRCFVVCHTGVESDAFPRKPSLYVFMENVGCCSDSSAFCCRIRIRTLGSY